MIDINYALMAILSARRIQKQQQLQQKAKVKRASNNNYTQLDFIERISNYPDPHHLLKRSNSWWHNNNKNNCLNNNNNKCYHLKANL